MSMVTKYSIRGINPKHNIPHIFIGDASKDGLDILEGNSCSLLKFISWILLYIHAYLYIYIYIYVYVLTNFL